MTQRIRVYPGDSVLIEAPKGPFDNQYEYATRFLRLQDRVKAHYKHRPILSNENITAQDFNEYDLALDAWLEDLETIVDTYLTAPDLTPDTETGPTYEQGLIP